jgi:hypothetical protein
MYAGGAGTAADNDFMGDQVAAVLQTYAKAEGRQPRVVHAVKTLVEKLFPYQGHIGANMIIGGIDETGPSLFTVAPHGSVSQTPFVADGSGLFGALAVLERGWREGISVEEGQALVTAAISAGIRHDQYSGSNVDMVTLLPLSHPPSLSPTRSLSLPLSRAILDRSVVKGFERGDERAGGRPPPPSLSPSPSPSLSPSLSGYHFGPGDTRVLSTKNRPFGIRVEFVEMEEVEVER